MRLMDHAKFDPAASPLPHADANAYEELGWEYWQGINELRLIGCFLLRQIKNNSHLSPEYFCDPLYRKIFLRIAHHRGDTDALLAEFAGLPDIAYAMKLARVFSTCRSIDPTTFERDMAIAGRVENAQST
jgi:hypothetical protein